MRQIKTANYIRVDKTAARRLYKTGQENRLYFCPVNLNPESPWGLLWNAPNNDIPFDQLVTEYEYYNCDAERGRYPAFYVPREWWRITQELAHEWNPGRGEELLKELEEWEKLHL